jgi:hypothetical protein
MDRLLAEKMTAESPNREYQIAEPPFFKRIEDNTLHHWVPANEALPATIQSTL